MPSHFGNVSPEGESIKPDDEDIDSADLGLDKTEGDELVVEEDAEEASAVKKPLPQFVEPRHASSVMAARRGAGSFSPKTS